MNSMLKTPCFRFAPSPNGFLHLGHAYSALVSFAMARAVSGRFLLRIEDIDSSRCREEYVSAIFEDLGWLGLVWPEPVLRQSHRFEAYRLAAQRLMDMGVLYPCFATRAEIARSGSGDGVRDPDGAPVYPGLYRGRAADEIEKLKADGRPFALRIDMARAVALAGERLGGAPLAFVEQNMDGCRRSVVARPERWGDAVIVRKDVPASYHLAVVVDDAFQSVSHVTRGMDLFAATDIHRLLQVLLGLPEPVYHHHWLIESSEGLKLSKSEKATSLRALRAEGWSARDVIEHLGLEAIVRK